MRLLRTVRVRIALLATLASAVLLLVAGAVLLVVLRSELSEQSDTALRERAAALVSAAAAGTLAADDPVQRPVTDEGLVQVVAADGRVLAASPNLTGGAITDPATATEAGRFLTMTAPDDDETERYRVWREAVATPDGVVTVLVGTSLESVDEATSTLRTVLLVGLPLVLVLVAAGTWTVVGRTLRRVEHVRAEVAGIGSGDLAQRLEPGPPDEVGQLVTTLNAMLQRLEDSHLRQRAFVADASHELQSPLTALRTQLEVAHAHPDGQDWDRLLEDLLEDADRLQALVGDLLALEVAEAAAPPDEVVDLRAVVAAGVAGVAGPGRGDVVVLLAPGPSALVRGDSAGLERVIRNLVENAVHHAGSRVDVAVLTRGSEVVVQVADDGPGVAAEHADAVFDRFWRLDAARSRQTRGAGLGLSIARAIATHHGGRLVLVAAPAGAVFELLLPVAREP